MYIMGMKLFLLIMCMISMLNGQDLANFLGQWIGDENLDSPSFSYENRNISVVVSEGGDREGFYIYSSSCDFLYNDDLSWAYHYFGFNKETNQVVFLRRFITPLGVLGYEQLEYELTDWETNFFVAQYQSEDGLTSHQIRVSMTLLDVLDPLPSKIGLSQNFPNPFNPSTDIYVSVDIDSRGSLIIYDLMGQEVRKLHEGKFERGQKKMTWSGVNNQGEPVSGGTYFCRLMIDGYHVQSQKMTLIK